MIQINNKFNFKIGKMKKFFFLITMSFVCCLLFTQCGTSRTSPESLTKEVNEAIKEGDYTTAYSLVDPYFKNDDTSLRNTSFELNEKILRNEIASLVESDNNGDNAAKIKFAIIERAKFNEYWASVNKNDEIEEQDEMLKYAQTLAKAVGNDVLANNLFDQNTSEIEMDSSEEEK